MPHPQPPHHPPTEWGQPVPASRLLDFIDTERLDACLQPLLPDAGERAFVLRCLVGEGPLHHRGANYVLLSLLAQAVQDRGGDAPAGESAPATLPVPMRLPPHLSGQVERGSYPLGLPTAALARLAGGRASQVQAMVDCLTDGPPQHALANVAMVALMERLLTGPSTGPADATRP